MRRGYGIAEGATPIESRPDPDSFAPQRIGPIGMYTRLSDDLGYEIPVKPGPWQVTRRSAYVVPAPPEPEKPRGFLKRWYDRRWNVPDEDPARLIAEYVARRRGELWGLVCGWCVPDEGRDARSFETLLSAVRFALRPELDFRGYAAVLRGDGEPGASLLAPSWGGGALARGAFAPVRYFGAHVDQLLDEVPWADLSITFPVDTTDVEIARIASTVAQAAPAFDGALACFAFRHLISDRVASDLPVEWGWASLIGRSRGELPNWPVPIRRLWHTTERDTPLANPETPRDVLHAALWGTLAAKGYADVIDAVVSLGGDTVATAAAAGALAGSLFGAEGIPETLRARVPDAGAVEALLGAILARDAPYARTKRRAIVEW